MVRHGGAWLGMVPPFKVVKDFEAALCERTGAKYAVTTTSCTMALLLACIYHKVETVEIPRKTYIGVPQSIIHAGGKVVFRDEDWICWYKLKPYPIYDAAHFLEAGMFNNGMVCISFHWDKPLGLGQGGCILHDDPEADEWLRKARFDGRTEGLAPKDDNITALGYHAYMTPETAAQGIVRLALLPKRPPRPPTDDYPDLSEMKVFQ